MASPFACEIIEQGLSQTLTYDHKDFPRIPWVQIEEF